LDNQLLALLPEAYHEIREFQELTATSEQEITQVKDAIEHLFNDQFVLTAREETVRRWERMLRIQADPSTETLEFRRKRIVNRLSTKPPFTERYLQERIDFLFGVGRGKIEVDVQNFILTLAASIQNAAIFREAERTIHRVKPANMEYVAAPWTRDVIEITDKITVNQRRYHKIRELRIGMRLLKYENEVVL